MPAWTVWDVLGRWLLAAGLLDWLDRRSIWLLLAACCGGAAAP
jgi:hypothetical protein